MYGRTGRKAGLACSLRLMGDYSTRGLTHSKRNERLTPKPGLSSNPENDFLSETTPKLPGHCVRLFDFAKTVTTGNWTEGRWLSLRWIWPSSVANPSHVHWQRKDGIYGADWGDRSWKTKFPARVAYWKRCCCCCCEQMSIGGDKS